MTGTDRDESNRPSFTGFAFAATFGLLATLLWIAPDYMDFSGWPRYSVYALGGLCISMSLFGAFHELGQFLGLEALGVFGLGAMVFVPALLLHLGAPALPLDSRWITALKGGALMLDAFAGLLMLFGAAQLLEAIATKRSRLRREGRGDGKVLLTVLSFVSAVLPIIVYFVDAINWLFGN